VSLVRRLGVWALLGPGVTVTCTLLWAAPGTPGWLLVGFGVFVGIAACIASERFDVWWIAWRARRGDRP